MRIFTTHHNVAEFEPQGPEDVEMAKQATDYVNYALTGKIMALKSYMML